MKNLNRIIFGGLIISSILNSCETKNDSIDNDPEFSIEFQDGTIITEDDILFYDSSTCILFLNNKLYLDYGSEGYPYADFFEFSVFVNNDTIFQGVIFPDYIFNVSPLIPFISSKTFPTFESDILPIKGFPEIIEDPRIIKSLEKSNLLHNGITCTIESVNISSDNDTSAICTISIKNHDHVNYYIPNPEKMGAPRFHYLIGGIELSDNETNEYFWPSNGYPSNLNNLIMDDLSILESKGEVTYSYKSSYKSDYNSGIKKGLYGCILRYGDLKNYKPFSIPLDHEDGRVWVGRIDSGIEYIIVE